MPQYDLIPELRQQCAALTPKLEKLVHSLDWVRIEEWSMQAWLRIGRKPHERSALANAFVANAVLGLSTTMGLIERLTMDRSLKVLCEFSIWKQMPNEATFSRAFVEFAQAKLEEHRHEVLVKNYFGDTLIGHISSDGTAIEAREKPASKVPLAIVVPDNTPIHHNIDKKKIDGWHLDHWLILLYLTPYSPELNSIEILCKHAKYHWRKFTTWTKDSLLREIGEIFDGYGRRFKICYVRLLRPDQYGNLAALIKKKA